MRKKLEMLGPYLALAILLVICVVTSESFRAPGNYIVMAQQASYTGLTALGMTFVIAAGGIDLSVGSLFAFCGVAALKLASNCHAPTGTEFVLTLLFALGAGALGGALNGALVSIWRIPPFIVTLGTMSIFRSLSLYLADAGRLTAHNDWSSALSGFPTVAVFAVAAVLSAVCLHSTPAGRHVCAVGSNEKVAVYAGIPAGKVQFFTYFMTGIFCGLSAFLWAGRMDGISSSSDGIGYELDAIAAVIVGGTSMSGGKASVAGTAAGVLILTLLSNALIAWGVSPNLKDLVKGIVIITAVLLQYKKGKSFQ